MSCNNTNSTCSSCNHNYSSCNNKCNKCGCKDSFLTSPPPCPTPAGCPDPIPCQEVLSSDCIIYNGPDISCNNTVIITSDSTWTELLEDLVAYFCTTYGTVPLISCGVTPVVTAGSSVNSALQQIVAYFCTAISSLATVTANNGLTKTVNNIQLGGPLVQNTTITNSTFALNINSTTVPALALQRTSASGFTLDVNPVATTAQAISAKSTTAGSLTPVVEVVCQSSLTTGSQAIKAYGVHNTENSGSPISAIPAVYIESASSTAKGATNSVALRVGNTLNGSPRSGVSIEFGNTTVAATNQATITNRIISKTSNNTSETQMASEFVIQGKPTMTVNPVDQLTLKSTGQLQLNQYGTPNNFTSVPAWSLSTDAVGNVIQTTAGLFGTAFRGYISPNSFPSKTFNKPNSKIDTGDIVIFDTTNGIIEYQIQDGLNVTSQYNQTTGVWTCPQTGKYDINYNVYLTSPANTYGWGQVGGTFTIGVTDPTGTAIIYCADTFTAVQNFYYDKIYMTGGIQGKDIPAGTQIVLRIQNLTGVAYTQEPSRGDNIDWAIRRVG
jgi:hypothetical protein